MGLSAKDLLAKTSSPERVKRVCLNGKLRGEHDVLRDQLDDLMREGTAKMGTDSRATQVAEQIQALEAQMVEDTVAFRFRGLSHWRVKEIQQKFPSDDPKQAWDVDAGAATFIAEALVDPELSTDEVGALLEKGNSKLADELFSAAWLASNQENDVPKSVRASGLIRGTGQN